MIFADSSLAARIEAAECGLLAECAASTAEGGTETGRSVWEIAGGVAIYTVPDSPLNKLAGLGFDGPPDETRLALIERAFAARAAPLQAEVSSLADPKVCEVLTRRGYVMMNVEHVLGRKLPTRDDSPLSSVVDVSIDRGEAFDSWLDAVVTGFQTPDVQGPPSHESFPRDVLERVIRDMASAAGILRYIARRDGKIAGGASMRIHEGVAQLCGAATKPEHRRRGVQTALLATRLAEAGGRGCDIAVVTTQPGSKSHDNVQRRGFELLYSRSILVREP